MMRRLGAALAATLLGAALPVAPAAAADPGAPARQWARAVTGETVLAHVHRFGRFAAEAGGTRAAGTPGHDASATYVADALTAAGYQVTVQPYDFPVYPVPPVLHPLGFHRDRPELGRDFSAMLHTPAGEVSARVHPVDVTIPPSATPNTSTSGCEAADFAGFPPGRIALVQRGTCNYRVKADHAAAAGAVALIAFNEGQPDRLGPLLGSLSTPGAAIPAFSVSYRLGARLAGERPVVRLRTPAVTETRRTSNVTAQTPAGDPARVLLIGAHLDSAPGSPGLNDSATGSAALLEMALRLRDPALSGWQPARAVRFAWWSSAAVWAPGATHYVYTLPPAEVGRIAAYLDADALGSTNHISGVLDGDPGIARLLRRHLSEHGNGSVPVPLTGASDTDAFATFGIPVGGVFGGADGRKTPAERRMFGGRAGEPYDPCHRLTCDGAANVDPVVLARHTAALTWTAGRLAATAP
ncbi:M28 family peptidase [Jidongwangia harbinensis]|uniref:M28 family peptidase n=1 Tax=Jidongwangia harbinensis TaxID=2878561 RepID=UPI001CD9B7C6|nr:M28 family peptidase [Jidongwangia harbinensis]MCA2219259.1 M28 family peptidase [Jidongwangia harbinensis]